MRKVEYERTVFEMEDEERDRDLILVVIERTPPPTNGRPGCFARAKRYGKVFGPDALELRALSSKLGVRKVIVDREGRKGQHVDLYGEPLRRAEAMVGEER